MPRHDKYADRWTNLGIVQEIFLSMLNNFYWGMSMVNRYYQPEGEDSISSVALIAGGILSLAAFGSGYVHGKLNASHQPPPKIDPFVTEISTSQKIESSAALIHDNDNDHHLTCSQKIALFADVLTHTGDVEGGFYAGIDLITKMAAYTFSLAEQIPLHVMVLVLGLANGYVNANICSHAITGDHHHHDHACDHLSTDSSGSQKSANTVTNIAAFSEGMSNVFSSFLIGISLFYDPNKEGITSDIPAITVGCVLSLFAVFAVYAQRELYIYHQNHQAGRYIAKTQEEEKLNLWQVLSLVSLDLTTAGACSGLSTVASDLIAKNAFETTVPPLAKAVIQAGTSLFGMFGACASVRSCRDAMTPKMIEGLPGSRSSLSVRPDAGSVNSVSPKSP